MIISLIWAASVSVATSSLLNNFSLSLFFANSNLSSLSLSHLIILIDFIFNRTIIIIDWVLTLPGRRALPCSPSLQRSEADQCRNFLKYSWIFLSNFNQTEWSDEHLKRRRRRRENAWKLQLNISMLHSTPEMIWFFMLLVELLFKNGDVCMAW